MADIRDPEETMTDRLSKSDRSRAMAKVRSANTKPEWILRCGLHRLGFRYRLSDGTLPGRPDLVFPRYKSVIFVHGCYWHRHKGCKDASTPKSNTEFWSKKFTENLRRDKRTTDALEALGWRVLVLWECELTKNTTATIQKAVHWLTRNSVPNTVVCDEHGDVSRSTLLAVAEAKVRYRIARYQNNPTRANSGSPGE